MLESVSQKSHRRFVPIDTAAMKRRVATSSESTDDRIAGSRTVASDGGCHLLAKSIGAAAADHSNAISLRNTVCLA